MDPTLTALEESARVPKGCTPGWAWLFCFLSMPSPFLYATTFCIYSINAFVDGLEIQGV